MNFDSFLETAWNDHADHPQEVAERLTDGLATITTPAQFAPFAHLAAHVYGAHLGRWDAGVALLEGLRRHACWDGSAAQDAALSRQVAALRYAGDEKTALADFSTEDRISILAMASGILAGHEAYSRAIRAYDEAIALAESGLADGSPALRALAVGGNNLAAALEEKPGRDAVESRGMVAAAEGGLKYWKRAGTWLEEERAEYRLARSLIAAEDPQRAATHAGRCIEICVANQAAPFELFFGHVALAMAQRDGDCAAFAATRDRALELYAQVADDEKAWCAQDLAELQR